MDEIVCCLLGICCASVQDQRATFEAQLTLHFNGDEAKAKAVCAECFDHFAKATKKVAAAVKKAEAA